MLDHLRRDCLFSTSAWPRVVIILIIVAALAQFFFTIRSDKARQGQAKPSATSSDEAPATGDNHVVRIAMILGLPVLYAALLDITGFYFTTPLFIAAYLWLNGERRVGFLIGTPVFIYAFLLLIFTRLLYINLASWLCAALLRLQQLALSSH